MTISEFNSCQILWSTQSGRAKACARRTARILKEQSTLEILNGIGTSFDETPEPFVNFVSNKKKNNIHNNDNVSSSSSTTKKTFLLLFVSTTGDGEHCDSIRTTWKALLQKALSKHTFQGHYFALFCLGDRAYGPQFCAAGRKLAVRLLQLGMKRYCDVGYGDDNTPNGGVFRDLDDWLEQHLLPTLENNISQQQQDVLVDDHGSNNKSPFHLKLKKEKKEEESSVQIETTFRDYFTQSCPITAYSYDSNGNRMSSTATATTTNSQQQQSTKMTPLCGKVLVNKRITAPDWDQDTRHIQIHLQSTTTNNYSNNNNDTASSKENNQNNDEMATMTLPYRAGDVASILPFNSDQEVERFLQVLPQEIQSNADDPLEIIIDESRMTNCHTRWPCKCTLRSLLKYCADIHSLPEREDLRVLSQFCSPNHEVGKEQSEKLRSLSETSEGALYADYILREKRTWTDVLYDFEALRSPGSRLTIESLLIILPPMRPREFSIASSPSSSLVSSTNQGFIIELCVAVVKGKTRLGREHYGLCSEFLSRMLPTSFDAGEPFLQVWIRPGTFEGLPLKLKEEKSSFEEPVLCIGAGTGIAPLRALLLERDIVRSNAIHSLGTSAIFDKSDNILLFGCRKESKDYYYKEEWREMKERRGMDILTAFSRDQRFKIYVQQVLRDNADRLIVKHILGKNGAVYIAGGPKMARAVKDEIIEQLGKVLEGGENSATKLLKQRQRIGKFSIEAWS